MIKHLNAETWSSNEVQSIFIPTTICRSIDCDCHDYAHRLVLDYYKDYKELFVEVVVHEAGLWGRIRSAWTILTGRDPHVTGEIIIPGHRLVELEAAVSAVVEFARNE